MREWMTSGDDRHVRGTDDRCVHVVGVTEMLARYDDMSKGSRAREQSLMSITRTCTFGMAVQVLIRCCEEQGWRATSG